MPSKKRIVGPPSPWGVRTDGGVEEPDMSEEDEEIAGDILVELGKKWYAEDIASGRIKPSKPSVVKPPKPRAPRVRKAKAATPVTEPDDEPWIWKQWRMEDEARDYEFAHPNEHPEEEEGAAPVSPKPSAKRTPRTPRTPRARKQS